MTVKINHIRTLAGVALRKATEELKNNNKIGRIGWVKSAQYKDGTQVAYIATIQDQGYPEGHIPARPFMKPTVKKNKGKWDEYIRKNMILLLRGKTSIEGLIQGLVEIGKGDLQTEIKAITSPPLKATTIKRRAQRFKNKNATKSLEKPLVDTAVMLNSITADVVEKGTV